MRFVPFPAEVAGPMAERIRQEYQTEVAERRRNGNRMKDRTAADWPAYRRADGVVRICYDLYQPEYPEDATPGLADCELKHRFYANETEGFEYFPFNFRPLT